MLKKRDLEAEILEIASTLEVEETESQNRLVELKNKIDGLEYWTTDYHEYRGWIREYNAILGEQ
ncbi:TPA: hypothetical protein ACGWER_001740 [Streptococcus agalactiae]|nr:hypothetical protein [Streptococcus agalactiae]HEO2267388.1 hypothetical protein [Streptococcus agalactiae]HEO7770314.1 hypothetical protein [Streptococcus agalactiae]